MTGLDRTPGRAGGTSLASPGIDGQPAVRIRGLNHAYGEGEVRQQVLFDLDFEVDPASWSS